MELLVFLCVGAGIYFWFKNTQAKKRTRELNRAGMAIHAIILQHARTLAIKQKQLIYKDDYGNYIIDRWEKEVMYFIENVLLKSDVTYNFLTGGSDDDENDARLNVVKDMVSEVAQEESLRMIEEEPDDYVDVDEITGEEFESYCVSILNQNGWDARATQSTGDQGVDIVASINDITAVFQCKRYSQPVGNSAVQEIIAGKSFSRAQIAAVVTNSTFTKSARQLAEAANIYLLHYTELEEFSEMIISDSDE
jgi:restriction system protein